MGIAQVNGIFKWFWRPCMPKPAPCLSFQAIKKLGLFNPTQNFPEKICDAASILAPGEKITLYSSFLS
jgi:hypothetical protein